MHEKYKSGVGRGGLLANKYSVFGKNCFSLFFRLGIIANKNAVQDFTSRHFPGCYCSLSTSVNVSNPRLLH